MTDYLTGHAVVISTNDRELVLDRKDLEVFHAVLTVFPGSEAIEVRIPGQPPRPIFRSTWKGKQ